MHFRIGLGTCVIAVTISLSWSLPAGAQLTGAQQRCIISQNHELGRISRATGNSLVRCLRRIQSGKETRPLAQCITDDDKGKISKATQRLVVADQNNCQGVDGNGDPRIPPIFYSGTAALAADGVSSQIDWIPALFGGPSTVFLNDDFRFGAPCQRAIANTLRRCQTKRIKQFEKCARRALQAGRSPSTDGADTQAELAQCFSTEFQEKADRFCDRGLTTALDKGCYDGSTWETLVFSGLCPSCDRSDIPCLNNCLAPQAICAFCQSSSQGNLLGADCDIVDDGAANGSCL